MKTITTKDAELLKEKIVSLISSNSSYTVASQILTILQENEFIKVVETPWFEGIRLSLINGHKLQAVKDLKEHMGIGLKDAKDLVDKLGEGYDTLRENNIVL